MYAQDNKTGIFSISFIAVSFLNLLIMTGHYWLLVIISPYVVERFGAPPSLAGLAAGILIIGCLAGRFVTGGSIERIGFKRVLYIGLIIYTVSMALYLVTHSLVLLLVNRFISGVGIGFIGTMTGTVIAHIVPPRQQGLGISYFSLSTILGLAAGPFLGILFMQKISYESMFLICMGFGLASFCLALLMKIPKTQTPSREHKARGFILSDYVEYKTIPLGFVVLIAGLCYITVQAFLSLYAEEMGLMGAARFYFLIYAIVVFASRPITGRVFDHLGENIVLLPALLCFGCSLLLLGLTASPFLLLLSAALFGLGFGNFQSLSQAATLKLVPRERFGQATSTFFILFDFGVGIGPYVFGLLVPKLGYSGMYLAVAAVSFTCLPLYYLLHGRKRRPYSSRAIGRKDGTT